MLTKNSEIMSIFADKEKYKIDRSSLTNTRNKVKLELIQIIL